MLLGKRTRLSMRRTTSMSFVDLKSPMECENNQALSQESGICANPCNLERSPLSFDTNSLFVSPVRSGEVCHVHPQRMLWPLHFLHSCFLCRRVLFSGQDIYMYRGESAFCSVECREKQIVFDEWKENSSMQAVTNKSFPKRKLHKSNKESSPTDSLAAAA